MKQQSPSLAQQARALEVSLATLKRALSDGDIIREGDGSIDLVKAQEAIEARSLRRGGPAINGARGGIPRPLLEKKLRVADEELRLLAAKREFMEMQLAEKKGDLGRKSDYHRAVCALVIQMRDAFSGLSRHVAFRCESQPAAKIGRIIDDRVSELFAQIKKDLEASILSKAPQPDTPVAKKGKRKARPRRTR